MYLKCKITGVFLHCWYC